MNTIKNRALRGLSKLTPLVKKHCTNLISAVKEVVHLLKGKPILMIVADLPALAKIIATEYPSLNGCCQLASDKVYHLVAGAETRILRQAENSTVKIQTTDLTDEDGEVILADIARLDKLETLSPYVDVVLIAKSSDLTDSELARCAAMNVQLVEHVGVIYVGPQANRKKLSETFAKREIAFFDDAIFDDANGEFRKQITKCFGKVLYTNLHIALRLSIEIAEKMRIRIDEKYAEAERAAALDLEGTYDEKVEASDRFFSASQQRKTTLKHDIDRISKEKSTASNREFAAAKKGGVHQKAVQIVNGLEKPKDFNEDVEEKINEAIYIAAARVIEESQTALIEAAATVYNSEAAGMLSDLKASGFSEIQPVSEPLEIAYVTAKNAVYRDVSSFLVAVDLQASKLPRMQSLYRQGWPTAIFGSAGYALADFLFSKKEEEAAVMLDFGYGGAETLVSVDGGALMEVVRQATTAGFIKTATGAATGAQVAAAGATATTGLGGLGIAATATATVATGGIAIIFAGGFALLGAVIGRGMLNDSQVEAYKKEYRSAIAATMHVIGSIVAAIVSTSNEHVTDQATKAFNILHAAIESAVSEELAVYEGAEAAAYLLESLPNDKRIVEEVASELSDLEDEAALHVDAVDLFDLLTSNDNEK